jgi:hypothetical protein
MTSGTSARLQLGTIERCIRLWSNPGELVFSPFTGIGSEGYEALRLGRRFVGFELKPSYAAGGGAQPRYRGTAAAAGRAVLAWALRFRSIASVNTPSSRRRWRNSGFTRSGSGGSIGRGRIENSRSKSKAACSFAADIPEAPAW